MSNDSDLRPKILLVEGKDDKRVVEHLWEQNYGSDPPFRIEDKGGIDSLLRSIPVEIKSRGLETMGIMLDSNDDVIGRWQSVVFQLKKITESLLSDAPHKDGFILHEMHPKIGIWLMPNNDSPGELENFISELIPENDLMWPLVEGWFSGITDDHRKFNLDKELRAKIHVWLSTLKRPLRMGTAIKSRDLNSSAPIAKSFCNWLNNLFSETSAE